MITRDPTYIMLSVSVNPVQWCDLNGFKISMNKTVAVLFTRRRDRIDNILKINGESVKVENKAKFLGIIFDSKLSWNDHVNYIVDKCKKRLNLLRAISGNKWGANKKTLLMIYRSLIRSILDYGAVALDSMSESNKKKLDVIQMQALRIASGAICGTANSAIQVDMGEPLLQLRRLQQQLQYAAKVKSTHDHPTRKVFEGHWTIRWGKYNENTAPIYSKVHDFFVLINDITWEAPRYPPEPPWRRKELCVDISVSKEGNKKQNRIIAAVANEKIDRNRSNLDLHIYTEASKTPDGRISGICCLLHPRI